MAGREGGAARNGDRAGAAAIGAGRAAPGKTGRDWGFAPMGPRAPEPYFFAENRNPIEGVIAMSSPERVAFIVGAPRSGTTSLACYLEEHPDVCFSYTKEPHFFSQYDLRGLPIDRLRRRIEEDYLLRYFPHRPREPRMLAEGSVSYLFAAAQMEPILKLWPEARFVICLRDPLEMLPSLHQRLVFNGDETVRDFAQAWALMPERAQGRFVPRTCFDPRALQYAELGRLGTHVERFFRAVGRERCHVVLLEDLAADPAAGYRALLGFLGLPEDGREEFPVHRGRQGYKSGWLQRLLKRPPARVRLLFGGEKMIRRFKPLNGDSEGSSRVLQTLFAARARLLKWNEAPPPPLHLPYPLRREISETLAPEIALLSRVIDRDLSHWLGGRTRSSRAIMLRARAATPNPIAEPARQQATAG